MAHDRLPSSALVDTLSPGAHDGPTGRGGSAARAHGSITSETPDGDIRASDTEHEQVAAEPGRAVGAGRLTLAESSDRVEQAHAAPDRAPVPRLRLFSIIGGIPVRPR